jgi:HSP20 family molecular chaperone IbpA
MNSRLSLLDSPLFLGFDHFEQTIDRLKKTSDGYPPYNIEKIGDYDLRITLAVAGFTMNDLDVEIENNQLTIRGKQTDDKKREFIHRGIAARQFQRSFILADGVEIEGASLDNGLLHIDMKQIIPEPQVQKIRITSQKKSTDSKESTTIIDVEGDNA